MHEHLTKSGIKATQLIARAKARPYWKRLLVRLITYPLVIYIGILVAHLVMENQLLFRAAPASSYWAEPPAELAVEEVTFTAAGGAPIYAWWCPRPGAKRTILLCQGSGGNLSCLGPALPVFQRELDASVLIFDYPGYGRSGGTASEAGCYAAADAAYTWLTETQQVPADQILITGHSLGGAVAVDLASRRPHAALVLISTFTSMPDMAQKVYPFLPARWLVRNQFDSRAKIGQCRQPVFIAHCPADNLIPLSQAEELYAAAGPRKQFFVMEGVGHGPIDPAIFPALRSLLAESAAPAE